MLNLANGQVTQERLTTWLDRAPRTFRSVIQEALPSGLTHGSLAFNSAVGSSPC